MDYKQEMLQTQICVLSVNMRCHCDGCKKKIRKLRRIDGVYDIEVNVKKGRVIVIGNADPADLIDELERSEMHAEIWGRGILLGGGDGENNMGQMGQMGEMYRMALMGGHSQMGNMMAVQGPAMQLAMNGGGSQGMGLDNPYSQQQQQLLQHLANLMNQQMRHLNDLHKLVLMQQNYNSWRS